ncbi:hypothetical protein PPACK8108_LOCUS17547, partial [Phakopsora pachyrhizi]
RAINLSILTVSGPGSTPGGALPSIPLSFSLVTVLPHKTKLQVSLWVPNKSL